MLLIINFLNIILISPILWLSPTEHDFGTIPQGQVVFTTFRFQNTRPQPILIDNIRTECGCTEVESPQTPIAAGATAQIRVQYDARKKGYFKKKISVWWHNIHKSEKLYITGEVE